MECCASVFFFFFFAHGSGGAWLGVAMHSSSRRNERYSSSGVELYVLSCTCVRCGSRWEKHTHTDTPVCTVRAVIAGSYFLAFCFIS